MGDYGKRRWNVARELIWSTEALQEIADKARDWLLCHGVLTRTRELPDSSARVEMLTTFLLPFPVPRSEFTKALELETAHNSLMHRASWDTAFLFECYKTVIEVDEFTRGLWNILVTINSEPIVQRVSLGIFRNDLMLHRQSDDEFVLKQVEINTIASGMAGVPRILPEFHEYMIRELKLDFDPTNVARNDALKGVGDAMAMAWKRYGNEKAVVLFLVHSNERSMFDHRWYEWATQKSDPRIRVVRRDIQQVTATGVLDAEKRLFISDADDAGPLEVAFVYFRTGYGPSQYPSKTEWETRLMIERSAAIKCPSIRLHLAGGKRVQQALSRPGVIERYFPEDPTVAERLRTMFVRIWALDEDPEEAVKEAISNPSRFVLKPQREGGSNNFFGDDLKERLGRRDAEWKSLVLMDRLMPPSHPNIRVDPAAVSLVECSGELGIFGAILADDKQEHINATLGYLIRLKDVAADEGGISIGAGGICSVYPTD